MAMKVNELMIGDWVVLKSNGVQPDTKIRITGLSTDGGFVDDCDNFIGYEELDPIPLTEEILMKNGFKKESQTIDGDYCKYILPGFALNWCDTDGFWYQNGDITPNHVHTLQHLLRLVGVQKEIEL